MFSPYLDPMLYAQGGPLNPGPGGSLDGAGPSTINLTDPSRYGTRPEMFGGGPISPMGGPAPGGGMAAAAPAMPSGMFGTHAKHSIDKAGLAMAIAAGLMAR